eukprot:scaffold14784_cov123-Isochrysis_galbana.AAC.6
MGSRSSSESLPLGKSSSPSPSTSVSVTVSLSPSGPTDCRCTFRRRRKAASVGAIDMRPAPVRCGCRPAAWGSNDPQIAPLRGGLFLFTHLYRLHSTQHTAAPRPDTCHLTTRQPASPRKKGVGTCPPLGIPVALVASVCGARRACMWCAGVRTRRPHQAPHAEPVRVKLPSRSPRMTAPTPGYAARAYALTPPPAGLPPCSIVWRRCSGTSTRHASPRESPVRRQAG